MEYAFVLGLLCKSRFDRGKVNGYKFRGNWKSPDSSVYQVIFVISASAAVSPGVRSL